MCLTLCASLDAAVSARTIPGDPDESLLFYSQRFLLYNVTSCKSLTELHHRIPISCIYGSLYMVKIVFYSHFICLINPYESLGLTQMMDANFHRNSRYFCSGTKASTKYFLWDSVLCFLPTLADGVSGLFDKQALTIMPLWDCGKSNEKICSNYIYCS